MKIIIYTINNCSFCQQEKEYLQSRNLPFEEKNLDQNHDFLTEMLALSNNFVGVPFTVIEKDNGEKISLKGYAKEEFDKALEIASEIPKTEAIQTETSGSAPGAPQSLPEIPTDPSAPPIKSAEPAVDQTAPAVSAPTPVEPPKVPPFEMPSTPPASQATVAEPPASSLPPSSPAPISSPLPDLPTAVSQPEPAVEPPVISQPAVSQPQPLSDETDKAEKNAVDLNQDVSLKKILDDLKSLSEGKSHQNSQTVDYQPKAAISSNPPKIPDFPK